VREGAHYLYARVGLGSLSVIHRCFGASWGVRSPHVYWSRAREGSSRDVLRSILAFGLPAHSIVVPSSFHVAIEILLPFVFPPLHGSTVAPVGDPTRFVHGFTSLVCSSRSRTTLRHSLSFPLSLSFSSFSFSLLSSPALALYVNTSLSFLLSLVSLSPFYGVHRRGCCFPGHDRPRDIL